MQTRRQFIRRAIQAGMVLGSPQIIVRASPGIRTTRSAGATTNNKKAVSAGGGGGDTTTGLIGWWKLDDGSGGTAVDSSASGNNGTLVNSPSWISGRVGTGALSFASASSQVVTANTTALSSLSKATLAGWINRTSTSNKMALGAGSIGQASRFNFIWYSDGNIYFDYGMSNSSAYAFCALTGTGWHHAALVFDGTLTGNARITAYIDGVLKTLSYNSTPPTNLDSSANLGNFLIGKEVANGYSDGSADDVCIYNRPLVQADITALASM